MRQNFLHLAILAIALGGPVFGAGESSAYQPVKLSFPLEAAIPADLKQLFIKDPLVKFLVMVGPEGELTDYLAIESPHVQLLEKAAARLQDARFEPATLDGVATTGKITVIVTFFDPEQRAWKRGMNTAPFGGNVSDAVERRLYESNPENYAYKESKPTELDSGLTLLESKIYRLHAPDTEPPQGQVVVEYFVDHTGRVCLPMIVRSDDDYLSMSALMTLKETRFAPPTRNGRPTFVRVRQPFNFD